MTEQDCTICCEKYNKSTYCKVICEYSDCDFTACKSCVRTYLLGTTANPHCMNCKKPWNENFLVNNLNRTFYDKEYKPRRKELLVEREMSRLPETMHLAERQKLVDVEEEGYKTITDEIKKLNKQVADLKTKRYHITARISNIKSNTNSQGEPLERRQFIMACPVDNCRGFLSTQYKCSICELYTCPHCLEVVGHSKTDPHECNPDNVSSAEAIKKDTKPCPSCGVRIFKISGCSQMWCTECKVAFNYTTGKIDTGVVHNPHFYAHMAQLNQGQHNRNPQDVLCGGLIHIRQLNILLVALEKIIPYIDTYNAFVKFMRNMHRTIAHITWNDLPDIRGAVRQLQDAQDLRIRYILGKIDKKEIGKLLYQRDMKHKKQSEQLHLYELMSVVGIETFSSMVENVAGPVPGLGLPRSTQTTLSINKIQDIYTDMKNKIVIMDNMRKYINNEFMKISITYNHQTLQISNDWNMTFQKFTKNDLVSKDVPMTSASASASTSSASTLSVA